MRSFLARRPEVVLTLVTLLWSSTFVVTEDIVESAPPLAYLATRFGLASLVLLLVFGRSLQRSKGVLVDGAVLGFAQGAGVALQVIAQTYTTASKAAFVSALSTALTPLLALVLHGERPARAQAAAIVVASLGLYLLTYPTGGAAWNPGDLLSLGCALIYALVIVETSRRSKRHDAGSLTIVETGAAALTFVLLLGGEHLALRLLDAAHVPSWLAYERRPLPLTTRFAVEIAWLAIGCTVVTLAAQNWAMRRMTTTHAAVVFALEPVFATTLAVIFLGAHEWPGARGGVGAAFVVAAVLLSELKRGGRGNS